MFNIDTLAAPKGTRRNSRRQRHRERTMNAEAIDWTAPAYLGSPLSAADELALVRQRLASPFRPLPIDEKRVTPAHRPLTAEDIIVERALLAWNDPTGEADAAVPLDPAEAFRTIAGYARRHRPRPQAVTAPPERFDNATVLLGLGADPGRASGIVRCPAHEDRSPSLSWRVTGDRLLLRCFAGCSWDEILAAVAA